MIELSKFYGDNNNTEATVYRDANGFFATVKSSSGVYCTNRFNNEEDAEFYAEELAVNRQEVDWDEVCAEAHQNLKWSETDLGTKRTGE